MAVLMYHEPSAMSVQDYESIMKRLSDIGADKPDGRLHHFAFEIGEGRMAVTDVWVSQEKFEAFGETLGPILAEYGIDGEPQLSELYSWIQA